VIVGLLDADDAAVVRLNGPDALVLTLDFFTPLVDDAYTWGRIAAANAVSDVYAMGGRPVVALNIVGWPRDDLPLSLLADVLRGGAETAERAGFLVVGGHSVDDAEPKYGMVVVGRCDPDRILTLDGAHPGDALVLTKPIGTGIVTTALKADAAPSDAVDAAVASMTALNDAASRAFVDAGVEACTDVTGFGLLGHLVRMLETSGHAAEIDARAVPVLPHVRALAEAGHVPGGTRRNMHAVDALTTFTGSDELTKIVLCDAQTSGGLLAAVAPDALLQAGGVVVGRVVAGEPGRMTVSGVVS
jgi:selenide,water dikinase